MKSSLNAVWGWTRISDPRGPVPSRGLVMFSTIFVPLLVCVFSLRDTVHLQDGVTEWQKASPGGCSIH